MNHKVPVWTKNICSCFMALERIMRVRQPLTANPSPSSPLTLFLFQLSEDAGATTVLVIKRRRHVRACLCLYLSHTHEQTHTGRLLSISSTAHLQLSQQATKEDPDSVFQTWPRSWSERSRRRVKGTCNKEQLAGMVKCVNMFSTGSGRPGGKLSVVASLLPHITQNSLQQSF